MGYPLPLLSLEAENTFCRGPSAEVPPFAPLRFDDAATRINIVRGVAHEATTRHAPLP